jgi:hypothetical protein
MEFVVIGVIALVMYAVIERFRDEGSKKAERLGLRANRRD